MLRRSQFVTGLFGFGDDRAKADSSLAMRDYRPSPRVRNAQSFARYGLAAALVCSASNMPASGQTLDEYQQACQDDALRFCSEHVPDHAKVKSCLLAHKTSLTDTCRALLRPAKKKA
jgi:hypothetical protein